MHATTPLHPSLSLEVLSNCEALACRSTSTSARQTSPGCNLLTVWSTNRSRRVAQMILSLHTRVFMPTLPIRFFALRAAIDGEHARAFLESVAWQFLPMAPSEAWNSRREHLPIPYGLPGSACSTPVSLQNSKLWCLLTLYPPGASIKP